MAWWTVGAADVRGSPRTSDGRPDAGQTWFSLHQHEMNLIAWFVELAEGLQCHSKDATRLHRHLIIPALNPP